MPWNPLMPKNASEIEWYARNTSSVTFRTWRKKQSHPDLCHTLAFIIFISVFLPRNLSTNWIHTAIEEHWNGESYQIDRCCWCPGTIICRATWSNFYEYDSRHALSQWFGTSHTSPSPKALTLAQVLFIAQRSLTIDKDPSTAPTPHIIWYSSFTSILFQSSLVSFKRYAPAIFLRALWKVWLQISAFERHWGEIFLMEMSILGQVSGPSVAVDIMSNLLLFPSQKLSLLYCPDRPLLQSLHWRDLEWRYSSRGST